MLPAFPSNTREQIEQMILMDGRTVTFYVIDTLSGCSLCSLDPITNTSTDSFCPTCSGDYWIPTYSGWDVTAHVTWGRSESRAWETGGMLDNGDCTVKYMHTPSGEYMALNAEYVMVDGRKMDIQPGITLRGIPDVNRIIVHLKEEEN